MTGKRSRTKGARGERMAVSVLSKCFPDARRGRQYDSARECDIEGTPLRIEHKFRETISYKMLLDWLERNSEDGKAWKDDRPPILLTKRSKEPVMFHGFLEDLIKIVETLFYKHTDEDKAELSRLLGDVDEDSRYR